MTFCVEDELEAIEAVLSEDYNFITDTKDDNYSHCFEVFCFPSDDLDDCHCSVQLIIKVPTAYPYVIPTIQILSMDGISQNIANNLIKHLNNRLNQLLEQEMLYNIIDITKEYLKQYNFIGSHHSDNEFCIEGEGEDDDDFNDDADGWGDINQYEDDNTFAQSLQSIQNIIESEQKEKQNTRNVQKHVQKHNCNYNVLTLHDVIDDDRCSPRLLAVADVYQLAMSNKHLYAECRSLDDGSGKYEIRIGVQISKYIQTKTLLNVLGFFNQNDYMVIALEFDKQYVHNATPPTIIQIGRSVPHKQPQNKKKKTKQDTGFEPIKLKNKLEAFLGNRSVMNRINNKLFARLWPPTHLHPHYPSKYKQILQLMAITNHSYDHCKTVMHHLKNYENALVYLSQHQEDQQNTKGMKQDIEINKEMEQLCDRLISYGWNEILQKHNDENDGKIEEEIEGKMEEEMQHKCDKHCIQNELRKFLLNTCCYFMHNILLQILYFAMHSVLTLSKRCLVCDIEFPSYSGLIKPTICNNILCLYGHEELEIGLDIASMIRNTPEIVDLLITFCFVSAKKGKLNNGPIDVHGLSPNEHINFKKTWTESDNPYIYQQSKPMEYNVLDTDKLMKVLNKMPSIDTLLCYAKKGNKMIKKSLCYKSPLLWPLLRWIVVTNRSYMVPLRSKQERFDSLPSCFQFKFVSYTPEREYMFQELSRKNNNCGTIYAWHGSPMANWHNILRNGLKNMSNTKHMRNGACFGRGIYLAPDSGTSYWYCEPSRSDTWALSMLNRSDWYGRGLTTNTAHNAKHTGHGLYCLALCEILKHPKLKSPEPYYVVPTESWVMIRYVFVFNTVDNKRANHWTGKGRYFDIEANTLMKNYLMKQNTSSD